MIGLLGWYIGDQTVELAAKIPEYRDNIHEKIVSLHLPQGGALSRASDAVKSIILEIKHAPGRDHVSGDAIGYSARGTGRSYGRRGAATRTPGTRPRR